MVHLRTNYFHITIGTSKELCRYTVVIKAERKTRKGEEKKGDKEYKEEESKPGRKRRQAFAILFEQQDFRDISPGFATDYSKTVLTAEALSLGASGSKSFTFLYRDPEDPTPSLNATRYTFTITRAGSVPIFELLRYLASATIDPNDVAGKNDAIQALNIIVAKNPNFNPNIYQSGKNKFFQYPENPGNYLDLGAGLIAVRGYYSSVRSSTGRVLLNLNAQTSPFYPAIGLLDLMARHGLGDWLALENFLNLLRVKTDYIKDAQGVVSVRIKTIQGFSHRFETILNKNGKPMTDKAGNPLRRGNAQGDHGNARQITFRCEEFEENVTVEEYYKRKHDITLKFPEAYVINTGKYIRLETHRNVC